MCDLGIWDQGREALSRLFDFEMWTRSPGHSLELGPESALVGWHTPSMIRGRPAVGKWVNGGNAHVMTTADTAIWSIGKLLNKASCKF